MPRQEYGSTRAPRTSKGASGGSKSDAKSGRLVGGKKSAGGSRRAPRGAQRVGQAKKGGRLVDANRGGSAPVTKAPRGAKAPKARGPKKSGRLVGGAKGKKGGPLTKARKRMKSRESVWGGKSPKKSGRLVGGKKRGGRLVGGKKGQTRKYHNNIYTEGS